jgi:hypothetical protein
VIDLIFKIYNELILVEFLSLENSMAPADGLDEIKCFERCSKRSRSTIENLIAIF